MSISVQSVLDTLSYLVRLYGADFGAGWMSLSPTASTTLMSSWSRPFKVGSMVRHSVVSESQVISISLHLERLDNIYDRKKSIVYWPNSSKSHF